jgi:DNA-binding NarL/FixJ family response regulator
MHSARLMRALPFTTRRGMGARQRFVDGDGLSLRGCARAHDADEEEPLRRALDTLQRLEARPAAAIVARRLRKRGARSLPRGPRPATRQNQFGLTRRELDVLALVNAGLQNGQIADQLVVSVRTVDHHVEAILRKLGARTRSGTRAAAKALGLIGPDR